ncbi:MAG: DUF6141 family protein [Bacteroidia bacterium]
MKAPHIQETQRGMHLLLRLLMIALILLYGRAAWSQWILGEPWGNNPSPDWLMALILLLLLATAILMFTLRLDSELSEKGIRYRLFPLQRSFREIPWSAVQQAGVRKYRPIAEYGGWGIRGLPKSKNRAVSLRGDYGIQLVLKDGRKLLIGTARELEMKQAIEHLAEGRFEVL